MKTEARLLIPKVNIQDAQTVLSCVFTYFCSHSSASQEREEEDAESNGPFFFYHTISFRSHEVVVAEHYSHDDYNHTATHLLRSCCGKTYQSQQQHQTSHSLLKNINQN